MFSDTVESRSLQQINHELQTSFSSETLNICSKKLDQIKIKEIETIAMGPILSKTMIMNGMPKTEYMKKLNRIPPRTRDYKRDLPIAHVLTSAYEDLLSIEKFADASEIIQSVLLHSDNTEKECITWMKENSEKLIDGLIALTFFIDYTVLMEISCFTIAIIVYRYHFVFEKYFKRLIGYLIMIIIKGCTSVQDYVDLRNQKWTDTHSMSFEQENEPLFHFPLFSFKQDKCQNRLLSVAYFTLGFCFDCVKTPAAISRLMAYAVNTREISRVYIVSMFHKVILSMDKEKCKTDPDWIPLPLKIHSMIIKFYMDKNAFIRKLVSEINVYIKHCTEMKLPIMSKPILDTVDIMVQVMKRKNRELHDLKRIREVNEVNAWRQWLDLEKKIVNVSSESDSNESSTSRITVSKPTTAHSSTDDDREKSISKEEWASYELSSNDLLPGHVRQSIILPDLMSIVGLTKLRTRKARKQVKKAVRV